MDGRRAGEESRHHQTEETPRPREVSGKLGVTSYYVAFTPAWDLLKWAGYAILLGPQGTGSVPGDPTPAPCVSHTPNTRPKSSLGESMGRYTGSEPAQRGQRCGKGGGAGVWAKGERYAAPLMGMTMGWMTRPEGGSSCDLVSPELGPNRGQGQSIGLRSRDGQICTSRIESGAECWPICGLQCGIQLHVLVGELPVWPGLFSTRPASSTTAPPGSAPTGTQACHSVQVAAANLLAG